MDNMCLDKNPPKNYINSIIRATNILELFSKMNAQYLGISEISHELGLQKTIVFNIVKTLVHQGWMVQDTPNGKYRLGTRILVVSSSITRNISTEDLITKEMKELRDVFNEDVVLTGIVDGVPICVGRVQSNNVLQIYSQVGRISNMLQGSTGKCLLAFQPQEFIDQTIEDNFSTMEEIMQEKEKLYQECESIRSNGFCITTGEVDAGVATIAVPIMNNEGFADYSLAISGEENRMRQKGLEEMKNALFRAASRIKTERALLQS